jgi:chromosome transmission fidelity protein 1
MEYLFSNVSFCLHFVLHHLFVHRCVIVVGLPYPHRFDPELREKMRRLNASAPPAGNSAGSGISNSAGGPPARSLGEQYYEHLCMRAVNQSIGRAVRHAGDYAAILLLDERYSTARVAAQLPQWIARGMHRGASYGEAHAGLAAFFKRWRDAP